ncbi:MAG: Cupin 2, conserved barrel domain protein [Solirubrobacterales bacterium]|nr:Cupin 2, conserved barrel domain protein [Solirubrobacterales bacterium]
MRRVVTAQTAEGASVFVSDEDVAFVNPVLFGGNEIWKIWQGDTAPTFPTDGTPPEGASFFPPDGGFRLSLWTIPAATATPPEIKDMDAAIAEAEDVFPGITTALTDNEGMHRSDTLDWIYVVSGEVTLTLDGGEETTLRQGDSLIQNGTNHAWSNRSDEKVLMLLAMLGGSREGGGGH